MSSWRLRTRSFRYHVNVIPATLIVASAVAVLSYLLGDLLSRRLDSESSLLFLASRQAAVLVVAACVSAAYVATMTVRYLRSGVSEHEQDATRTAGQLLCIRFAWHVVPPVAAWLSFLVITSILRATGSGHLFSALGLWFATSLAVVASGALGLAIAHTLRSYAAPVLAALVVYFGVLVVGADGDEAWWGWLTPYMDDAMRGDLRWIWFLGYSLWYAGVTLTIVVLVHRARAAFRWASTPSRHGRVRVLVPLVMSLGVASGGLLLLFLNGAEASSGL